MVERSDSRSFEVVTVASGPETDSLGPDPFDAVLNPELFDGVTLRRLAAYMIDLAVIGLLLLVAMATFSVLGMLSFGVLSPVLFAVLPFIPLAYHTILIGGPRCATLGMRLFGIENRRLDGGHADYLQAGLLTVVFYVSVGVTGWLILLVALFNGQGRTFHDYLCGTVTIRPHLNIDVITPSR
jgi:uncharacterized RDD family membrane protein YckC